MTVLRVLIAFLGGIIAGFVLHDALVWKLIHGERDFILDRARQHLDEAKACGDAAQKRATT